MQLTFGRRLARTPVIGGLAVHGYRTVIATRHVVGECSRAFARTGRWLLRSRETTNYSYPITAMSRHYIAAAVGVVARRPAGEVLDLFREAETDHALSDHLERAIAASIDRRMMDRRLEFGRRLAWYAAVRLLRPRIVVETGVDKGLGSCLLAAALLRNVAEGHPGRYFGTDINPAAGAFLSDPYAEAGEVIHGDSIETLRRFDQTIDIFINDSDHSADYEAAEYEAVRDKLSEAALVIGDNCERTDRLFAFAVSTGRAFLFAKEDSEGHFFPGSGVGFAFPQPR